MEPKNVCRENACQLTKKNFCVLQHVGVDDGDILVSYDVSSLFTNVPLEETIQLLADKAFINNWFNETYHLNLNKLDLVDLLRAATKDQLFTFNGQLYEQTDGVATGSPIGPLLANAFMCSIEETLEREGKMPTYYKRFVDDTDHYAKQNISRQFPRHFKPVPFLY